MKVQKCIVRNKSQLIAAFGCAMDCWYPTEIKLIKKDGSITEYKLGPLISFQLKEVKGIDKYIHLPEIYFLTPETYHASLSYNTMKEFNHQCSKARTAIRKIPAEAFR